MAWFREKAILDYNSGMSSALRRGRKEGREEGEKKAKLETAKSLLSQGVELSIIIKATGLTEKELQELQVNK